MSELEGQSTAALERLCAQYELEQRQHGEQVEQQAAQIEALRQRIERQDAESETLRRQFERLDGQMTRLAQDYRTLAATLRGRWT